MLETNQIEKIGQILIDPLTLQIFYFSVYFVISCIIIGFAYYLTNKTKLYPETHECIDDITKQFGDIYLLIHAFKKQTQFLSEIDHPKPRSQKYFGLFDCIDFKKDNEKYNVGLNKQNIEIFINASFNEINGLIEKQKQIFNDKLIKQAQIENKKVKDEQIKYKKVGLETMDEMYEVIDKQIERNNSFEKMADNTWKARGLLLPCAGCIFFLCLCVCVCVCVCVCCFKMLCSFYFFVFCIRKMVRVFLHNKK